MPRKNLSDRKMVVRANVEDAYQKGCPETRHTLERLFPDWCGEEDITPEVEFRYEFLTGRHYIRLYWRGKQIGYYQNRLATMRTYPKHTLQEGGFTILVDLRGIFKIVVTSGNGFKIVRMP